MPCTAPARGAALGNVPPNNPNPCGRRIITSANGVDFTAHSLCLAHLNMKLGLLDVKPPYVDAA